METYIYWPGAAVTAAMVVLYGVLWVVEQVNRPK